MNELACKNHIVLIGIGHTNAHIVRMWGMNPIEDTDLTCISDRSIATYSGMLPAALAGQIPTEAMEIDLVRLCSSVGARLITNRVSRIDHTKREVLFDDRPPVPFDALSIGIGSVPTTESVELSGDSVIKIKPMQTFLHRLSDKIESIKTKVAEHATARIVVVGSGVAGIEILFCVQAYLEKHLDRLFSLQLVTRSEKILPSDVDSLRERVLNEILSRGHTITNSASVLKVDSNGLTCADGAFIEADLVIWATGASAPDALDRFGLPQNDRGFLSVDHTLQSTAKNGCFAVGDTGTIVGEDIPKAGVYAVRQGPILWRNLQNQIAGKPLAEYRPQKSFLKLINAGNGRAFGQWKGVSFSGRWVMILKNWIDTRFMRMYQVDGMSMPESDQPMQCRGCGCKLAADVLESAIAPREGQGKQDEATIPLQDAAVISSFESESQLIASTDFFSSPFSDAYLTGRVAALHSASDIIATGGSPTHALSNVVLAEGSAATQQRWLSDFLAGARREFTLLGASIVGGHTIVGPRTEIGFTVIGKRNDSGAHKAGLRVGDALMLTKPIGTGVLMAALMQSKLSAAEHEQLIAAMLAPQATYAKLARLFGAEGMTDVTGFGLAGHLIELLRESDVIADLDIERIPLLKGVAKHIDSGIESTLAPDNERFQRWMNLKKNAIRADSRYRALFDPQTCGGLLLGIQANRVESFTVACKENGIAPPNTIGSVTDRGSSEDDRLLSIDHFPLNAGADPEIVDA